MSKIMTDLGKVSLDAYTGQVKDKYSKSEMDQMIRGAVEEAIGGKWESGSSTAFYRFLDNKNKVFAVMAEMMPVAINASLAGRFDGLADFKDEAMGDETSFQVMDNRLFKVVSSARGNQSVDRQTIVDQTFRVPTVAKTIKIYAELDMFMAGRIDWADMINRVSESFANEVGLMISNAIYDSYNDVNTDNRATGAFDADTLDDIIEHVKASTGAPSVQILGASSALGRVTDGFGYSDAARDRANNLGYWGEFRGASMFQLPQAYVAKTRDFAVNRSYVIIAPAGEKIAKVAFEGAPFIAMNEAQMRNDLQPEFLYQRRVGAAAIVTPNDMYGLYRFA